MEWQELQVVGRMGNTYLAEVIHSGERRWRCSPRLGEGITFSQSPAWHDGDPYLPALLCPSGDVLCELVVLAEVNF